MTSEPRRRSDWGGRAGGGRLRLRLPALPAGGEAFGAAAAAPGPPHSPRRQPPAWPGAARTAPTGSRAPDPAAPSGWSRRRCPAGGGATPRHPLPRSPGGGRFLAPRPARIQGVATSVALFPPKAAAEGWEGSAWEGGPAAAPGHARGGGGAVVDFPLLLFSAPKADGFIRTFGGGRVRSAPRLHRQLGSDRLLIWAAPLLPAQGTPVIANTKTGVLVLLFLKKGGGTKAGWRRRSPPGEAEAAPQAPSRPGPAWLPGPGRSRPQSPASPGPGPARAPQAGEPSGIRPCPAACPALPRCPGPPRPAGPRSRRGTSHLFVFNSPSLQTVISN